jgi:hypothetical protein
MAGSRTTKGLTLRVARYFRVSPPPAARVLDGIEQYIKGALVAVRLGAAAGDAPPAVVGRTVLFRAPYDVGPNTMYDVSPDGERFVIVQPSNQPVSW